MTRILLALSSGTIFGLGLSLSQMINPEKVQNFLDIAGHWDPSLAFVMLGALAVSLVSFRFVLQRPAPLLADSFHVSRKRHIDRPLLLGAMIFGIGWGMAATVQAPPWRLWACCPGRR